MTPSIAQTTTSDASNETAALRESILANGFLALFAHRVDADPADGAPREATLTTPDTAMGLVGDARTVQTVTDESLHAPSSRGAPRPDTGPGRASTSPPTESGPNTRAPASHVRSDVQPTREPGAGGEGDPTRGSGGEGSSRGQGSEGGSPERGTAQQVPVAPVTPPPPARMSQTNAGPTAGIAKVGAVARGAGMAGGQANTSPTAPVGQATGAAERRGQAAAAEKQPRTFRTLRDEVAHQASKALGAALKQQGGKVTMRLAPDTLGSLRVEMQLSKAEVSVRFSADQAQARELLSSSLDALRATLESHGLRVSRMEVKKGRPERGSDPGPRQDWKRVRLGIDAIV